MEIEDILERAAYIFVARIFLSRREETAQEGQYSLNAFLIPFFEESIV